MTTVDSLGEAAETTALVRGSRKRIDRRRGGGRGEDRGVPRQPRMDRASSSETSTHGRPRPELDGDDFIWDLNSVRSSQRKFDHSSDSPPNSYHRIDDPGTNRDTPSSCSLLFCGDAKQSLRLLPDETVQTVVTSPPYWSLRDYEVADQTGRDDSLQDYLADIVAAFDELKRVLRNDGTVWLNAGDVYTSGNRRYRAPDKKNRARAMHVRPPTPRGLKPKDLIGVPWRLAFLLQEAGWWIRSEVVWHKPNAHPESVGDRPTKAHETVFLLSKSQNYYYDVDAVRGPNGRRLRTVWDIPTEPVKRQIGHADDHPAMMPMTLARRCVAITSREDSVILDPYAGSGTTLLAAHGLGRRWIGIELNSGFVDLIERRLRGGS